MCLAKSADIRLLLASFNSWPRGEKPPKWATMSMMNPFETRWQAVASSGNSAGRFRVYPDHPLNIYVQYSIGGDREVVVEAQCDNLPPLTIPKFTNIDLVVVPIPCGMRMGMRLLDERLAGNFATMCWDLAERSRLAPTV